jgi:SAM-dependent methyltransferase
VDFWEFMGSKLTIDEFVDSYWPLPWKFDHDELMEPQREAHLNYLIDKYGYNSVREYDNIVQGLDDDKDGEEFDRLLSFVFRTGMYEDVKPDIELRSRDTLRAMLYYLSGVEEEFNVTELGCGSGRASIGIAGFLDNVMNVLAVDKNFYAVRRTKSNISSLSDGLREKVEGKTRVLQEDFIDEGFVYKHRDLMDYVVACHLGLLNEPEIQHILPVLNEGSILLLFSDVSRDGFNESDGKKHIQARIGEYAGMLNTLGMDVGPHVMIPYVPDRSIIGIISTRNSVTI